MVHVIYEQALPPREGHQTLVFSIYHEGVWDFAWLRVSCDWLAKEASITELKTLALAQSALFYHLAKDCSHDLPEVHPDGIPDDRRGQ